MTIYGPRQSLFERPPPPSRSGTCVVCKGEVTEKFEKVSNAPHMIGGNHGFAWQSSGLYCTDCGIVYHHLPKVKNNEEATPDPVP
jgi:hypothetical protein